MPGGFPRSAFDAFRAAARRRNIDSHVVESNRTLVAEFEDALFLLPFIGTHRIQRVPKGETKRHTSTATLAILDDRPLNRKCQRESPGGGGQVFDLGGPTQQSITLDEADLEERFTRGTGNGGQHKNKTSSCTILTHTPTGTQVRIDGRSQWNNRQEARIELARRLSCSAESSVQHSLNLTRVGQIGTSDRAEKGFTYNEQRDEVVCHATGQKWRLGAFMKGRF